MGQEGMKHSVLNTLIFFALLAHGTAAEQPSLQSSLRRWDREMGEADV